MRADTPDRPWASAGPGLQIAALARPLRLPAPDASASATATMSATEWASGRRPKVYPPLRPGVLLTSPALRSRAKSNSRHLCETGRRLAMVPTATGPACSQRASSIMALTASGHLPHAGMVVSCIGADAPRPALPGLFHTVRTRTGPARETATELPEDVQTGFSWHEARTAKDPANGKYRRA